MSVSENIEKNKKEILEILGKVKREGMGELIEYLKKSTYFIDPASSYYHNNFPGGLADHSLKVYKILKSLCKYHKQDVSDDSIAVIALLHDFCKIGSYKIEGQWLKNESTNNKWKEVYGYGFKPKEVVLSHGYESVYRLNQFIRLDPKEAMAIAHHMGPYSQDKTVWDEFRKAFELHPVVLLMHNADMESSVIYEKTFPKGQIPEIENYKDSFDKDIEDLKVE